MFMCAYHRDVKLILYTRNNQKPSRGATLFVRALRTRRWAVGTSSMLVGQLQLAKTPHMRHAPLVSGPRFLRWASD